MCVAIPGRVIAISKGPGPSRPAEVVFGDDETREIDLAMVPAAEVGDYVITHSGFAISVISETAAVESYKLFGMD